jgi:hypothetical protein
VQSDAAGAFAFDGLGRHLYELRIAPQEWAARPMIVDARSGDCENVVLSVEAGTAVTLEARWPVSYGYDVEITYRDGTVAMPRRRWYGGSTQVRHMLSGSYDVRIFDGDSLLRTSSVVVGPDRLYLPLEP